jgi:sortase A
MKKAVAVILIITGIALVAYPKLKEYYYDYRQARLLEAWEESLALLELPVQEEEEDIPESSGEDDEAARAEEERMKYIEENMEGMLKIDRIRLKIPILKGATGKNLLISVSSLTGTAGPGETGNYCIAGHRCRTYGRHFNRLDEIEDGDSIEVITGEAHYVYEVFEKIIIKPEETWVMAPRSEDRLITLITCDYSSNPSVRLIVRGRLTSEALPM